MKFIQASEGGLLSPSQHPTSLLLLNSFQDWPAWLEAGEPWRTGHTNASLHLTVSGEEELLLVPSEEHSVHTRVNV